MTDNLWKRINQSNFPILFDCYIKIGDKIVKADVHSACAKKGVFFNVVCPITGKITARKIQAEFYALTEEFEKILQDIK